MNIAQRSLLHSCSLSSWKKKILTTTTRKWESEGEGNVGTVIREMLQYKWTWRQLMCQFWSRSWFKESANWTRDDGEERDLKKKSALWWFAVVKLVILIVISYFYLDSLLTNHGRRGYYSRWRQIMSKCGTWYDHVFQNRLLLHSISIWQVLYLYAVSNLINIYFHLSYSWHASNIFCHIIFCLGELTPLATI